MTTTNVTIRHARHAINLLLTGAVQDIESACQSPDSDECHEALTTLFQNVVDVLDQWDIPGTFAQVGDPAAHGMIARPVDQSIDD